MLIHTNLLSHDLTRFILIMIEGVLCAGEWPVTKLKCKLVRSQIYNLHRDASEEAEFALQVTNFFSFVRSGIQTHIRCVYS